MAARSVWKGFIRFGMVTLPVKAYTATASEGGGITLNQLHKDCGSRIKYQKTCPQHGEVQMSDIVSGYQYAPDQYVVIEPTELEKARSAKEKSINIAAFISPDTIDPAQYSGRTLYLVPDGPVGFKPYGLLLRSMTEQGLYAFAEVVFSNKGQVVLLRPTGGLLAMTFLSFASEVRPPTEFASEVPTIDVSAAELKMAKMLTEAMTPDSFDFTEYKDTYTERLQKIIEAKIAGKQITTPPDDLPQIPDLMDALRKSLSDAKSTSKKKPAKLAAPSKPVKAAKRKTS